MNSPCLPLTDSVSLGCLFISNRVSCYYHYNIAHYHGHICNNAKPAQLLTYVWGILDGQFLLFCCYIIVAARIKMMFRVVFHIVITIKCYIRFATMSKNIYQYWVCHTTHLIPLSPLPFQVDVVLDISLGIKQHASNRLVDVIRLTGTVVSFLTYFPTWVFPLMKMPTGGSKGRVSITRSSMWSVASSSVTSNRIWCHFSSNSLFCHKQRTWTSH